MAAMSINELIEKLEDNAFEWDNLSRPQRSEVTHAAISELRRMKEKTESTATELTEGRKELKQMRSKVTRLERKLKEPEDDE